MMQNVIDILKERGLIEALTNDELRDKVEQPITLYCGFDPTSDSLHLGSLVAIMGLAWFQKFGHTPVVILGGATGMIGDPSGKAKERQFLDENTLNSNVEGIRKNFEQVLDFSGKLPQPIILNNYDWFKKFTLIQFLRDVGKYFRVGPMLAKESVRTRISSEEGISFTEFSYQLLQGYDFLYLQDKYGVTAQIGGSDQWGNITAGIDLTRRVRGSAAYGMTMPLLTTSEGKKFGKTEEGAVWLSPEKLSPYQFYQYLYRVADSDVIKLMRLLTFMDMEEINEIEQKMTQPDYVQNSAQKRLAEEVTRIVHGEEGVKVAQKVTEAASPGSKTTLDADLLESLSEDMPSHTLPFQDVVGIKIIDLIVNINLQSSKGQARRLIRNGGFYLNNEKLTDENHVVKRDELVDNRLLLLQIGKKNKVLLRVSEE